jgi:hypothetical protein
MDWRRSYFVIIVIGSSLQFLEDDRAFFVLCNTAVVSWRHLGKIDKFY